MKCYYSESHKELEGIVKCGDTECKRPMVSLKNYDTVTKKIRCGGCVETKYEWKR